jgi:hypothetical protein
MVILKGRYWRGRLRVGEKEEVVNTGVYIVLVDGIS